MDRRSGMVVRMIEGYMDVMPPSFICPLSQDIFVDPVLTIDGQTYSRAPIAQWLQMKLTSPMTNEPLASAQLIPNISLRNAIEEFRNRRPMTIKMERLTISEELIGEGSFGVVMAGSLDIGGGRNVSVAVKRLPAMTRAEERETLTKELKVHMHACAHCSGVCLLHGICEIDRRLCMVMKRYQRSLDDAIRQAGGRLENGILCRLAYRMCRSLQQLHDSGILLRDIKPQNILLDAYDEPVFADFGISEILQTRGFLQPTRVIGTVNYMAPEAFDPDAVQGVAWYTDIWSMACVIVEMHTGQMPWLGLPMQQVKFKFTRSCRAN